MGYTTYFTGRFKLNKKLDQETHEFLNKFNETRRVKRDRAMLKKLTGVDYGIDGEFYVDATGWAGQDHSKDIIDYNEPPKTQPGLWCHWRPTEDGLFIEWDESEKFYEYVQWIEYLIEKVLEPKGYKLSGTVSYEGEDSSDFGKIVIKNNKVKVAIGKRTYSKAQ